jgi:cardiolipin synthase
LLIPVFLWTAFKDQLVASCLIIFVASFTDWLDGFAARKLNQFTRIGQLLDPISDRLYIIALIAVVFYLELANLYILIFILGRELLLSALMLYLKMRGLTGLPVHYLGKMGAFCLLIGLPGLIFAQAFPDQVSNISFMRA